MKGELVAGRIAGVWAVIAAVLFFASFFSSDAASFEPAGRYLYVYILLFSLALIIIAVLSALVVPRSKRGGE